MQRRRAADSQGVVRLDFALYIFAISTVAFTVIEAIAAVRRQNFYGHGYRRRGHPVLGIVIGIVGLALAGGMYAGAKLDLGAYSGDPSCLGSAATRVAGALCRNESISIAKIYRTTGRHSSRYMVLVFGDGSESTVRYAKNRYGNVWNGFAQLRDRTGSAQFFRNAVVAVQTHSGCAETDAMPAERVSWWALFGIVNGVIGIGSALAASRSAGPML
jgi:hypothetical protein